MEKKASVKHIRFPNADVPYLTWRGVVQTRYVNRNDPLFDLPGRLVLKTKDPYGQFQTSMVYEGTVKLWDTGHRFVFHKMDSRQEGIWKDSLRNVEVFVTSGGAEGGDERQYFLCNVFVPHGQGSLKTSSGKVLYEGSWVDGCRDGSGDGAGVGGRYFGAWRRGVKNGEGVLTSSSGDTLQGRWEDDVIIDGKGTLDTQEAKWTGNWVHGVFSGRVTYASGDWFEGSVLKGHWVYVEKDIKLQDGRVIKKKLDADLEEEAGHHETHPNLSLWERKFVPGHRHGMGKEHFVSGGHFEGYWNASKRHGCGVLTWPDGRIEKMYYEDGILVHVGRSALEVAQGSGAIVPSSSTETTPSASGTAGRDDKVEILIQEFTKQCDSLREEKKMLEKSLEDCRKDVLNLNTEISRVQMEKIELENALEKETERRLNEEKRRKLAEEAIETLDDEMKNLQQVQQRRVVTRIEEFRKQTPK
eukprot:TRINITY_DN3257_c0_g1_i1.p1 TRINITY_DN3257_c0_g1~~TRINITY_DN3257_c0_g1_i1.p1  ORF type:complete len:471 (-),score=138.94 TRINITY_DN3257_c0_g1_i1:1638-3050(-)